MALVHASKRELKKSQYYHDLMIKGKLEDEIA